MTDNKLREGNSDTNGSVCNPPTKKKKRKKKMNQINNEMVWEGIG